MARTKFATILAAMVVTAVIVGVTFAFTATNTVPATGAGVGAGDISGYDVSSVHYDLNESNPTIIDGVSFELDSAPAQGSSILVKLVATGSTWYECTNNDANVTCDTTSPQAFVAEADELTVVVAQ